MPIQNRFMLAHTFQGNITYGLWAMQPKLNGIRAIYYPEHKGLYTRNGTRIMSVPNIVETINRTVLNGFYLDGELYLHGVPFQELSGRIRRKKENFKECEFHLFDTGHFNMPFYRRDELLEDLVNEQPNEYIKKVPTFVPQTKTDAEDYLRKQLENGYEGVMYKRNHAYYTCTRSKDMLKYKPIFELDAVVIKLLDTTSRNINTFGAMLLQTEDGTQFKCAGLTDEQRKYIYNEYMSGRTCKVTVLYGAKSIEGTPIFPRFKAIRWDN
jgi:DNA ligase-1